MNRSGLGGGALLSTFVSGILVDQTTVSGSGCGGGYGGEEEAHLATLFR